MKTKIENFHEKIMSIEGRAYIYLKKYKEYLPKDVQQEIDRLIKEHKELVNAFLNE